MTLTAPTSGPVAPYTAPVSSAEFAAYLGATWDAKMQGPLDAAVDYVVARCGPVKDTAWTWLVRQRDSLALRLPAAGLTAVTAVVDPASTDVTAQVAATDVDWSRAIVWAPYLCAGSWRVTATSHREFGEDELVEAVLIIGKHLWETRRGQSARPAIYGGDQGGTMPSYSIPNRARDLMAGYLLPLVA